MGNSLVVALVDPSLFTLPYDAALTEGLDAQNVTPRWITRPLRPEESAQLPADGVLSLFYRGIPSSVKGRAAPLKVVKALSHLLGLLNLLRRVNRKEFDLVHVQWSVIPIVDAIVMRAVGRRVPVILTLHDSNPFNNNPSSKLQLLGFNSMLRAAGWIIVHTSSARSALVEKGYNPERVVHIPHGPLSVPNVNLPTARSKSRSDNDRWTIVLFGKIQPYKGLDVLIEAVGRLPVAARKTVKVIVGGEPLMDVGPLLERASNLGLDEIIEFRLRHLDDSDVAKLLGEADAFVFPYRNIEASGVLFLVYNIGKWIVASDLGSFSDLVTPGETGSLVPPGDIETLSAALLDSRGRVPTRSGPQIADWAEIGRQTRDLYVSALDRFSRQPGL